MPAPDPCERASKSKQPRECRSRVHAHLNDRVGLAMASLQCLSVVEGRLYVDISARTSTVSGNPRPYFVSLYLGHRNRRGPRVFRAHNQFLLSNDVTFADRKIKGTHSVWSPWSRQCRLVSCLDGDGTWLCQPGRLRSREGRPSKRA